MTLELATAFLDRQLAEWASQKPLVVGICGPQGLGKSFLADRLLDHCKEHHARLNCVGILIDDFYLTHAKQARVSADARKTGNAILVGRGLPGTHDVGLALQTMADLVAGNVPVKVPRYDKSAFAGEGDRLPESGWLLVERPVHVIVLEGWFNGFRQIPPASFAPVYFASPVCGSVQRCSMHHLLEINRKLGEYEALWASFDCSIVLRTLSLDHVYQWRREQEAALVARVGRGMSERAVREFVGRYMPMYHLYYWRTCDTGILKKGTSLCIDIDLARAAVGHAVR